MIKLPNTYLNFFRTNHETVKPQFFWFEKGVLKSWGQLWPSWYANGNGPCGLCLMGQAVYPENQGVHWWLGAMNSFEEVTPENKHDNGKSTICRCISYRKSGVSNVMLVFRGVSDQSEIQVDQTLTAMEISCMLFNEFGKNDGSKVKNHPSIMEWHQFVQGWLHMLQVHYHSHTQHT